MKSQIAVLDAGGQYCHLIARKVRELGVLCRSRAPAKLLASALASAKGVIISGGPASVYDAGSPVIDPLLLAAGIPVLGICYGQQLMAHLLGGRVQKGDRGEYGFAQLDLPPDPGVEDSLFHGIRGPQQVWMSHRDLVASPPPGFHVLASTPTCRIAAMSAPRSPLFTPSNSIPRWSTLLPGREILSNFVFGICGCVLRLEPGRPDRGAGEPDSRRPPPAAAFSFSSAAASIPPSPIRSLPQEPLGTRARAWGLRRYGAPMREGETEFVRRTPTSPLWEAASSFRSGGRPPRSFCPHWPTQIEPEHKRHIIGEEFVKVQERVLETEHFLNGRLDAGPGHHLSRHHRIRRHPFRWQVQGGSDQDPP